MGELIFGIGGAIAPPSSLLEPPMTSTFQTKLLIIDLNQKKLHLVNAINY